MKSVALLRSLRQIALTALSLSFFANVSGAETYPKREVRGVWVCSLGLDWPLSGKGTTTAIATKQKNEATSYLDQYKAAGINVIYLQVRPMGDRTFTKTEYTDSKGNAYKVYEPYSHYVSGTRGTAGTYDPLEYWVSEAHKRGMEIYAWINPYRWYQTTTTTDPGPASTFVPSNYTSYDKSVVSQGSIIHTLNNNIAKYCYNPALASTRTRIRNACAVITGNYDIDGIVFDDYFYPNGIAENSTAEDYSQYKSANTDLSIGDWRRQNVNNMVALCYETIHAIKPWVRFGISPAGIAYKGVKAEDNIPAMSKYAPNASDWQYSTIYSDPIAWMRDKTIDFISPQIYWSTTANTTPFGPVTEWWNEAAKQFDCQMFPSLALDSKLGADEYSKQVSLTRQHSWDNNSGAVLYSARFCTNTSLSTYQFGSVGTGIKAKVFQNPAILPATTRHSGANPGKVSGLKQSGSTLSWTALSGMRYVAYAIPNSENEVTAASERGGFRAEYIIDMCYSNSVSIPSGKTSGYWYAVTPLDRYGAEWEATTLNAPLMDNLELELASPANGAKADYNQEFSWTGTEGASFTLEIADSKDFANIVYNQTTTSKAITLDLEEWKANTSYFWRVKATKSGAKPKTSEVREFVTGDAIDFPDLSPAELISPADGSEFHTDITFTISPVDNAQEYELQISTSADFGKITYSGKVWSKKDDVLTATVSATVLADNDYFWRVKATAHKYDASVSETRKFVYEKLSGEQNYTMYVEPETYGNYDVSEDKALVFSNLWLRNEEHNALGLNGVFCRDMVARPAGDDQRHDIIYITGRTANNGSKTDNFLARFDAENGRKLDDLALSYTADDLYQPGLAGANDLMLDADNNLLTSTLALHNKSYFTVSKIDVTTGICSTLFSVYPSFRVDHAAVWGSINDKTYYIFTAENNGNNETYATRYTITSGKVADTRTCKLAENHSTAPTIHPVSATSFYVNGQATDPTLYQIGKNGATISAKATIPAAIGPNNHEITGMGIFSIDGYSFMAMPYSHPKSGMKWRLYSGKDFSTDYSEASVATEFPKDGIGTTAPTSGDMNQPVSILAPKASGPTRMFVYSPSNGLAAYSLYLDNTTGAEDITADRDDAEYEYFNLQGIRVTPSAPGIYIRRSGNNVSKVMIK